MDNAKSFDAETFVLECLTYRELPFAFSGGCDVNLCCKTRFLVQRTVILFDDSRGISGDLRAYFARIAETSLHPLFHSKS